MVTGRAGGVSAAPYDSCNLGGGVGDDPEAVRRNRSGVATRIGADPQQLQWMGQTHSSTVVRVGHVEQLDATDGVVTTSPGLVLAVLVADCVPVLAADPVAGVIGAAHAGRVGAADGIALALVQLMLDAGAQLDGIDLLLGPAICGSCYEVPSALQAEVEHVLPGSACETSWGTPGLDLRAGLRRQALEAGVAAVAVDERCTMTDDELFSHRRAQRAGTTTGRQAGLIWLDR